MTITLQENFRALFYAPFYAAVARGAFASAGADVRFAPSPDPLTAVAALASGEADVMWGGPLRVVLAHDRDPASDVVSFCEVVWRDPFFVIGRTPRPDFAFRNLEGLRLGVVSEVPTPWWCLKDDLVRAGVDLDAIRITDDRGMGANADALRAGALDAVHVFQPYAESLLAEGTGHLWYAAANRGPTAYTSLNTRRATIARRFDELVKVARGMAATLAWIRTAAPAEIAATVRPFFPDLDPAIAAGALGRYQALDVWTASPILSRDGFARLNQAMLTAKGIARAQSYADCVDTSVVEAALAAG